MHNYTDNTRKITFFINLSNSVFIVKYLWIEIIHWSILSIGYDFLIWESLIALPLLYSSNCGLHLVAIAYCQGIKNTFEWGTIISTTSKNIVMVFLMISMLVGNIFFKLPNRYHLSTHKI